MCFRSEFEWGSSVDTVFKIPANYASWEPDGLLTEFKPRNSVLKKLLPEEELTFQSLLSLTNLSLELEKNFIFLSCSNL